MPFPGCGRRPSGGGSRIRITISSADILRTTASRSATHRDERQPPRQRFWNAVGQRCVSAGFQCFGTAGLGRHDGYDTTTGISRDQFPMGQLRLHTRFSRTSLNATVSSEILNETSTLIDNQLRKRSAGVDMSQRLTSRSTLGSIQQAAFFGHERSQ
jgi:hypothetical protein